MGERSESKAGLSMRFRLIVITADDFFADEVKLICRLFDAGLQTLHIRKPNSSYRKLKNFIESIPSKYHKRLVIHSHYSLLRHFRLKGIHLTEKTKRRNIPEYFDKRIHSLSASFHSTNAIAAAKRKYDYVFLSPVFDSISKKDYTQIFDLSAIDSFISTRKNIIALGGIADKNIELIRQAGFVGAAVLGYIWQSKDPAENFRKLLLKI
jgi:thiamine-phosphate pyrophosphorylase